MLGGLHVRRKVSPKYATGHICSYETEFREDSVPFMSYFENSLSNSRAFCKSSDAPRTRSRWLAHLSSVRFAGVYTGCDALAMVTMLIPPSMRDETRRGESVAVT